MKSRFKKKDKTITVCSRCHRACCWQGIFMCDYADTASTVKRSVRTLERYDLENPDYWKLDYYS